MSDIMDTIVDDIPEDVVETPEVLDKNGVPINRKTPEESAAEVQKILSGLSQEEIQNVVDNLNTSNSGARKICTVKFLFDKKIAYRLDLFTHPEREEGRKVIEVKNCYNNFNDVVPTSPKRVGDFFKLVGVIRYVFPTTLFPIGEKTTEDSVVVTLENQFNQYIKAGKIKGMEIKIDRD